MPVVISLDSRQRQELNPGVMVCLLQAEEVRFRAQLQELEQQRMAVIETQWWKRERVRESEVASIKAEYAKLEQQTKNLLAAVQVRQLLCPKRPAECCCRTRTSFIPR